MKKKLEKKSSNAGEKNLSFAANDNAHRMISLEPVYQRTCIHSQTKRYKFNSYKCVYICINSIYTNCINSIHTRVHAHACVYIHSHHMHERAHARAHAHTRAHAGTHTHTHTLMDTTRLKGGEGP